MIKDRISSMGDSLHGTIIISDLEKKIISNILFNRLHNISQNSTAYMTFPSNRTKRFEHSFGTMHLCGEIFFHSISNADEKTIELFFNKANKYMKGIGKTINRDWAYKAYLGDKYVKSDDIIKKMQIKSGIYNIYNPSNLNDEQKRNFYILIEAIRITALLHDVGHPPFSHITENALEKLFHEIETKEKRNSKEENFYKSLEPYFSNGAALHEEMGNSIARLLLTGTLEQINNNLSGDEKEKIYNNNVFKILIKELVLDILNEKNDDLFLKDLHKIVSGTFDGDRLDYISRDSINSGLKVGQIEYDRIIPKMRLVHTEEEEIIKISEREGTSITQERFYFLPHISILNSIEDVFERRWKMYKDIIFHHRVVKTDYLLENCIYLIGREYLNTQSDIGISETEKVYLSDDISGLWEAVTMKTASISENSLKLIQWDDAWLNTVLKKYYFEIADINSFREKEILEGQLEELLTNKKYYFSIIKRKKDFQVINKAMIKEMKKDIQELRNCYKRVIPDTQKKINSEEENNCVIELKPLISELLELINEIEKIEIEAENDDDILTLSETNIIQKIIAKFYSMKNNKNIRSINDVCEELRLILLSDHNEILDLLIVPKKPNDGLSKGMNLYDLNTTNADEYKLQSFESLSIIPQKLRDDIMCFPSFFVYARSKTGKLKNDFIHDFRKSIGVKLANIIKSDLLYFVNAINDSKNGKMY